MFLSYTTPTHTRNRNLVEKLLPCTLAYEGVQTLLSPSLSFTAFFRKSVKYMIESHAKHFMSAKHTYARTHIVRTPIVSTRSFMPHVL